MKKFWLHLFMVTAIAGSDTTATQAQQRQWTDHISCLGSRGVCVRYRRSPTSNVWYKIPGTRIYEDAYPWGMGRVCPEGKDSTDNIFIFDPGSETTGTGYIGCPVCADNDAGQYALAPDVGTRIYMNVEDWENALNQ